MRDPVEVVRVDRARCTVVKARSNGAAPPSVERVQPLLGTLVPTGRDHLAKWPAPIPSSGGPALKWRVVAVLAIALVFLVLAGEFASFTIPLLVMLTVPLAGVGGILLLWMTGQSLNAVSLIGMVVMIGLADNDAVVKLDAIRRFREQGHSIRESVLLGGRQRLRAIAMTSLTTIVGVLPLVMGWGSGGELLQPLAAGVDRRLGHAPRGHLLLLPTAYRWWRAGRASTGGPVPPTPPSPGEGAADVDPSGSPRPPESRRAASVITWSSHRPAVIWASAVALSSSPVGWRSRASPCHPAPCRAPPAARFRLLDRRLRADRDLPGTPIESAIQSVRGFARSGANR